MKVPTSAFVVLATSSTALGSWVDWLPFHQEETVTETYTRTVQVCPCNGEVRVTEAHPAGGQPTGTVDHYTVTGAIDPQNAGPKTITKAGPVVVVFSTEGSMTTKTGVRMELIPTDGPAITKTIWTGAQPSDGLAWVDWEDSEDPDNGGTLTRSHTKTETVYGPAPTGNEGEPWADWFAPAEQTKAGPVVVIYSTAGQMITKTGMRIELKPTDGPAITKTVWTGPQPTDGLAWIDWNDNEAEENGGTLTRSHTATETVYGPPPTGYENEPWADWAATTNTKTKTKTTSIYSSSYSTSSSSSFSNGPIGQSTSSIYSTSSYGLSSSFSNGPIYGSTTLSSMTTFATSTSNSASSFSVGPIGQSTSSSLASSSSMNSFSVGPIDQSTSSSSAAAASSSSLSSSLASSSSFSVGPIGQSTTSSLTTPSSTVMSSSSSVDPIGQSTSSSLTSVSSSLSAVTSSSLSAASSSTLSSLAAVSSSSSSSSDAISSSSTSASAASSPSVIVDDVRGLDYITAILQEHNVHRQNHSAPALVWNPQLATTAGKTAATCVYAHDISTDGGGYGQNIGAGYTPNQVGVMITNDMYNVEMPLYPGPYDTNNIDLTNFNAFGHFTQIVWKSTVSVGCATQFCTNGLQNAGFTQYFTVCNYYPPGNYAGEYANVGAPLGQPTRVVLANAN